MNRLFAMRTICPAVFSAIALVVCGCQQPAGGMLGGQAGSNPWWQAQAGNPGSLSSDPRQQQLVQDLQRQIQDLNQRLARFDNANSGMEGEVASLQQRLQLASEHNTQLRQQLADAAVQMQQMQQQAQQRISALEQQVASGGPGGIAIPGQVASTPTLRANNSLMGRLSNLQAAGLQAQMDGDVIRIEIPSGPLFVPGSYQIQAEQQAALNQIAQAIRQHFPDQIVGIEAHWDGTPIQPPTITHHQLTATQALSVFNYLGQAGMPERQMFTMALGSNRPKYGTTDGRDRRVDIVIYPETVN